MSQRLDKELARLREGAKGMVGPGDELDLDHLLGVALSRLDAPQLLPGFTRSVLKQIGLVGDQASESKVRSWRRWLSNLLELLRLRPVGVAWAAAIVLIAVLSVSVLNRPSSGKTLSRIGRIDIVASIPAIDVLKDFDYIMAMPDAVPAEIEELNKLLE